MNLSGYKQQHGGTMLGVIIGALIGLGAALSVAVYVTKVPIPFLNKNQPKSADSDAAEAKKNRDWNPNGQLANKTPAKPVPPAPAVAEPVAPIAAPAIAPTDPAAASVPTVPTAAVPVAKPKASADPLGDLAKARLEAKAEAKLEAKAQTQAKADAKNDAKTDVKTDSKAEVKTDPKPEQSSNAGVDPFNYFVQAGAFRTPEDAEQQRAKLLLMGFQARVTEREQAGRTVFRVRLGPFDRKDDADKNKERLDSNGIETALVRVQR